MTEPQEDGVRIPIEHVYPDSLETRFADHVVVQHTEHEFRILFYETRPPIMVGSVEERRARLEEIQSIEAVCVARIVVPASRMPEMVRALNDNLAAYMEQANTREDE